MNIELHDHRPVPGSEKYAPASGGTYAFCEVCEQRIRKDDGRCTWQTAWPEALCDECGQPRSAHITSAPHAFEER